MSCHSGSGFWLTGVTRLTLGSLFLVMLQGCMADDGEPIWRGYRLPTQLPEQAESGDSEEQEPEEVKPASKPMVLTAVDRANSRIAEEPKEKVPLNLALPTDLKGEDSVHPQDPLLPNVFNTRQDPTRVDLSGKLYWDESEEARAKPLNEAITGGEVELRIRLP